MNKHPILFLSLLLLSFSAFSQDVHDTVKSESTWSVGVSAGSNYYNLEKSFRFYSLGYPDHDCRGSNSALPGWTVGVEARKKLGKYFSYATFFSFDQVPGRHWLEDCNLNFSLPPGTYSRIHTQSRFWGNHQLIYYSHYGKRINYHAGLGVVTLFHAGTNAYISSDGKVGQLHNFYSRMIFMPGLALAADYKLNNRFSVYATATARGFSLIKDDPYKGVLLSSNVGIRYHIAPIHALSVADSMSKSLFPKFIVYVTLGVGGNIGDKVTQAYSYGFGYSWYSNIKEYPEPSFGMGVLVKLATIRRFLLQLGAEVEQISYHGIIHTQHSVDLLSIPNKYYEYPVHITYGFKEQLVNFPLLINYSLKQNERSYFGVKTGAAFLYNFMGYEFAHRFYGFSNPRYGVGLLAGGTYCKALSKRMNFVLEPLIKFYFLDQDKGYSSYNAKKALLSGAVKVGIGWH